MPGASEPAYQANILIVDDTPENLQVLTRILKHQGYKIRPALSGELALQGAQEAPPDLILLDITMPVMDGYQVCERLKADEKLASIPVIFISALAETLDKVKAFSVGGVDYITKPFQFEEVQARVKTHLAIYRLQQDLRQEIAERKRAQAAEQEALRREMNLARHIQMSLLPQTMLDIAHVDIAVVSLPAQQVGGDLYGCYKLQPDELNPCGGYAMTVGDVSGKGIPAALYMAVCTSMLAAKAPFEPDVARLLNEMNAVLYPYTSPNQMNAALCYVRLEPKVSETCTPYIAHIANAGLVAPILRRGAECEYLSVGGLPLGAMPTALPYQVHKLPLQAGDTLVLSSDGITEAMNGAGEMYGFERFLARVATAPTHGAQDSLDWILEGIQSFVGNIEPHDDLTLMVIVLR